MKDGVGLLTVLFITACVLDFIIISRWKKYRELLQEQKRSGIHSSRSQLLFKAVYGDELDRLILPLRTTPARPRVRAALQVTFELSLLAVWAVIIGWNYLDMDPHIVPYGNEFGSNIQTNHLWTQVMKCGWCAVWNGFEKGGYPAFADVQGSMLHPITIITTLLWGVVNGVKIMLVTAFWAAGLAQWWLARELDLGWLPRMWSAGIGMAGGHLAGRMHLGVPGVVLSTAMTCLVIPALVRLARTGQRKDAVLLGVVTASAILSGQGYMQVGLIGLLPVAILFLNTGLPLERWKNYLTAAGIALLLSAPLLLPLAHFSPNIAKWMDPEFNAAQPLPYFLLNLVINDPEYFFTATLGRLPYPYLYTLYIGWIPLILIVPALIKIPSEHRKLINFLLGGAAIEFLIASGILLRGLVNVWPSAAGVRHSPQIAGLAIPLLLGLSACGLDWLLKLRWPDLQFKKLLTKKISLQWLLIIPLIFSLQSCLRFARYWLRSDYIPEGVYVILDQLKTDELQWVEPPFGEHLFIEPAIARGMKLSPGIMTWSWRGRPDPLPARSAVRDSDSNTINGKVGSRLGFTFYADPDVQYASVISGDKMQPCEASGSGGFIQVSCDTKQAGTLVVQENMWTGWQAWMDGKPVPLYEAQRLEVDAPSGQHIFSFRYLPWDVPVGLFLFVSGLAASMWICLKPHRNKQDDDGNNHDK